MKIGGGTTTYAKGGNYEDDTLSGMALVEWVALRVRGQATLRKEDKRCWRATINLPSTIFGLATK